MKPLKSIRAKGHNRRIIIDVIQEPDGLLFYVETTRLVDRKTRHILKTHIVYGTETIIMLHAFLDLLIEMPELKPLIKNESDFKKWKATVVQYVDEKL